jgi:hypothetical protein
MWRVTSSSGCCSISCSRRTGRLCFVESLRWRKRWPVTRCVILCCRDVYRWLRIAWRRTGAMGLQGDEGLGSERRTVQRKGPRSLRSVDVATRIVAILVSNGCACIRHLMQPVGVNCLMDLGEISDGKVAAVGRFCWGDEGRHSALATAGRTCLFLGGLFAKNNDCAMQDDAWLDKECTNFRTLGTMFASLYSRVAVFFSLPVFYCCERSKASAGF